MTFPSEIMGAVRPATRPPEARGLARDGVRLLVSCLSGHIHSRFHDLAEFVEPGSLIVVNRSGTLPASLPAQAGRLSFTLNLSTRYGPGLWLAEPRWSAAEPGPLPLSAGDEIAVGEIATRLVAAYPGLPRLWFVRFAGDVDRMMEQHGRPIRYRYIEEPFPPLDAYQTLFAKVPGSAEMPSAARPFTPRVVESLRRRAVRFAEIELHTGVSSLDMESEDQPLYGEPFIVPPETAEALAAARRAARPVIAVGTTVVRALESAFDGEEVRPMQGFTRRYIRPGTPVRTIDGLITGLHEPRASHLAMLEAIAGRELIEGAYAQAARRGYLWHEFGDSHLLLPRADM